MTNKLTKRIKEILEKKLNIYEELSFNIPIEAKPTSRPRVSKRGKYSHMYVPNAKKNIEEIRSYINLPKDFELIRTPTKIEIIFYLPFLYGTSQIDKDLAYLDYIFHISKPDIDNLVKTIFDAFNNFIWIDDCIVYDLKSTKKLSEKEDCHINIKIWYQKDFISNKQKRMMEQRKNKGE